MTLITSQTLHDLALCERRAWLSVHAPFDDAPRTIGVVWERSSEGALESREVSGWTEAVALTERLMALGVASIFGACIEVQTPLDLTDRVFTIRAEIDRLERIAHLGEAAYAPVLVCQDTATSEADALVLDLWVWVLDGLNGAPPPAELWSGADSLGRVRRRAVHDYDEGRVLDALTRAAALLAEGNAPPVRLIDACKACPHRHTCETVARQDGALDLLYGVSRRVRDGLRAAGLRSLADVAAAAPDDLLQVKGIGLRTAPAIQANARAWLNARPVHKAPLPDVCASGGWMFDLETLERNGRVVPWCMGWCDPDGHTEIALVAPVQTPEPLTLPDGQRVILAPDSDATWEAFAEAVAGDTPIFHWTGYDAAILRGSAPAHVQRDLLSRFEDLHRHFTRAVSLPLRSTSIKAISIYLGFPWPGYNEWFAAYLDYQFWLDSGQIDALARACMYQRADVQSMAWVWRWWLAERHAGRGLG